MKTLGLTLIAAWSSFAQNYTATRTSDHGVPVVRLTDRAHGIEVSIAPRLGNRAYEMKVHGKNILYTPAADPSELERNPGLSGIPFLAPWANRLSESGFWANGRHYQFNVGLGNIRGQLPIRFGRLRKLRPTGNLHTLPAVSSSGNIPN
jgi:aldose 1-epimerase